jgi:membrane protease YdiL (CAAX protease family)
VAPSQEFLIRGVAQTVLFRLLGGGHAKFWAIVLASLLFAVSHTYFSFWISVLSILGGFFWGFLYMRHQTIVGVAVSHFLIGDYMLATGIWKMLI